MSNKFTLTKEVLVEALAGADMTPGSTQHFDIPYDAIKVKNLGGQAVQVTFCKDGTDLMSKKQSLCRDDELCISGIKGTFPMALTT